MEYRDILERVLLLSRSEAEDKGLAHDELEKLANLLYESYYEYGYIKMKPAEALSIPMYSFALFLKKVFNDRGNVSSPVSSYRDSNWFSRVSLCYLNVRAVGVNRTGDFISATRVIPTLRVDGIHLSPFFDHAFKILYAIDCLWVISDDFINKFYLSLIPAKEQVRFFVETAHLLGKVVGFDLEPHTSQFSRVALEYPEYFRWIKLQRYSDGTIRLADNLSQREQLSSDYQKKIHSEVRRIVKKVLGKYGLRSFSKGDVGAIRTAHAEVISELMQNGLWTIPTHTWNGVGLPEFSHYVYDKNYPEFSYKNMKGEDHRDHAFGLLSPYKFYDNLGINSLPDPLNPPKLDRKVLNFFSKIPLAIIRKYGFDFIRWDFTDHIFDSIVGADPNYPISDRLTPKVIDYVVRKVKKEYPYVGMFFERMGDDFKNYYSIGADLILGGDIWEDISKEYVKNVLKLSIKLHRFNSKRRRKISVSYAVDTHDTENPVIDRSPMIKGGEKVLLLRFFLSRFGSAGEGFRPKYECIGSNDGTTGLFEANISYKPLNWKSNSYINSVYHNIEDTFDKFRDIILNGKVVYVRSKRKVVYWKIESNNGDIVCFLNLSKRKVRFNMPQGFRYIILPYHKTVIEDYSDGVYISSFEPLIGFSEK
ncbi:MAG: hypothetical protein N2712_06170 [Brevinematales bacterium]|nr:hypothetical protein [Brevinematales bacterium]